MRSWERLWNLAENYTPDDMANQNGKALVINHFLPSCLDHPDYQIRWSKANNPYFFQAGFAAIVPAVAHNFVVSLMSNHSAEKPEGTLTRDTLKSFFAVTGDSPGNFVHHRGQERIPENCK